jgi:hypothetical protein
VATPLAAHLRLAGVDVWLDAWEVSPGDSIIGKVSGALEVADTVVLLWPKNAVSSRWVNRELETALDRQLTDGSVRIIPVCLDDSELPRLLRQVKRIVAGRDDVADVALEIANIDSYGEFLRAVQQTIEDAGIEFRYFYGYGVLVACPKCGASGGELEAWSAVDPQRDDSYAGARCRRCRWEGGGEAF